MRMTLVSRVAALAIAALFVGGVAGASDLDAVLFHGAGAKVMAGVSHVETAANAACHAERCVLGLRLASARVTPRLDLQIRFESIPEHAAQRRPDSAPRRAPAGSQQQPRAPPVSIA